ncbi:SGNH/GDSL hydrolase family protein [Aquamicrobium ahrensii]|uniref:Lysophospholipase L1-like esterase n=1 Tax=Aquamicrobium ahrensii TaxID=469551 RepID=A0ABV2KGB0_9HYPH
MRTVLCYGDSLTWGYDASGPRRHALEDRWPSVLQREMGDGVHVIAEGLNGRTTAFDDNLTSADRNGARFLPTLLSSHGPLDLVIIMLGVNDMKPWIHGDPFVARQGMRRLVAIVRGHDDPLGFPQPQILIVAPPVSVPGQKGAGELAGYYENLADEAGCGFLDASNVCGVTIDGIHMDAENTRKLGEALAPVVRVMLEL